MKNIAIIGATGSLGSAFIQQLMSMPKVKTIYACSRSKQNIRSNKIRSLELDLLSEASIKAASEAIDKKLDLIIVASGTLHTETIKPEKTLNELSLETLHSIFSVNTYGPALVLKYFSPLLNKEHKNVFAILSARVGSISDNRLGGWYAYRASKAALNMIIKTASIELNRVNKNTIIMGLHPGTVDSTLSKPFQKRVPIDKLFTPEYSAKKLLSVIEKADESYSGECYDYNNVRIAY